MARKYPLLARVFHWVSAGVIVWALVSGLLVAMHALPPELGDLISPFNVSITTLLLPMFVVRALYRLSFKAPTLRLPPAQRNVAHGVHALMYFSALFSMSSGLLMMEREIDIFDWLSFGPLLDKGAGTKLLSILHFSSNVMLLVLLILHVGAVVKHHLNGFPILRRMSW